LIAATESGFNASSPEIDSESVDIDTALTWLERNAGYAPETSRRKLNSQLRALDRLALQDRNARRAKVGRRELVSALTEYYGEIPSEGATLIVGG